MSHAVFTIEMTHFGKAKKPKYTLKFISNLSEDLCRQLGWMTEQ